MKYVVLILIVLIGASFLALEQSDVPEVAEVIETPETNLEPEPDYIEFVNPTGFVNTDPITIGEFIGEKIILLKFTTYSCINCQRTYPHFIRWHEEYEDDGLLIIGIHTPEFAFEKDIENVRLAMQAEGIEFPIVLDNEYETWRAYGNRFWPRRYLIDMHGQVVYDHIGEGAYEETESRIQELLAELNADEQ